MTIREHIIGMLLGTEEDWPGAFEGYLRLLAPEINRDGVSHTFSTERITIEPFDLKAVPRYAVVIDRLAHWYYVPREWLKKIALMDDTYLLNNPFTFQAMEKHAAYCAMMRLGLHVPDTWLIPHKMPPENERFPYTAAKYNQPFDLREVAGRVGYPLYMKPFDGGAWVGVTKVSDDRELMSGYDESGERLMHLQAGIDDFDEFVRCLTIGAETMTMSYDPGKPLHDRYQIRHDFLEERAGKESVAIARLVNAFFRWEYNSCELIVKDGVVYPIDYANACPDTSVISLHYYFPWAIKALAKWSIFCAVTGRKMRMDQDTGTYFDIADRPNLSYEEKLERFADITEDYFTTEQYHEFCDKHLPHADETMVDYIESREFDDLLVDTVRAVFPAHEQDGFVAHYRGLLGAWAQDQRSPHVP